MNLLRAVEKLMDKGIIINTAVAYGEPGYSVSAGKDGILFGDWNKVDEKTRKALEAKYEIEWLDEWMVDGDTGKAWRTCSDGYDWLQSFVRLDDGELLTIDDLKGSSSKREDYINEHLLNNPRRADIFGADAAIPSTLGYLGFERYNGEYESGLREGACDKPVEVFQKLQARYDVVFQVSNKDQFGIFWNVWVREKEQEAEA